MTNNIHTDPNRRHDIVYLFDVKDGNPNGDPDAGNLPRIDPETMQGIVLDTCQKRKIRNYVDLNYGEESNMKIYVKSRAILANQQRQGYEAVGAEPQNKPNNEAREWMCKNFYDIRMFGAVMSTGRAGKDSKGNWMHWNCGQERGPVQITPARSVNQVFPMDYTITRVALTNADDVEGGSADDEEASSGQMGRKPLIPYGLYRSFCFINPRNGTVRMSERDLEILYESMINTWDFDRSAARGMMACRGLFIFSHDSVYGNAPAHKLLERVSIKVKEEVKAPRDFNDFEVKIDESNWPKGVTLTRLT